MGFWLWSPTLQEECRFRTVGSLQRNSDGDAGGLSWEHLKLLQGNKNRAPYCAKGEEPCASGFQDPPLFETFCAGQSPCPTSESLDSQEAFGTAPTPNPSWKLGGFLPPGWGHHTPYTVPEKGDAEPGEMMKGAPDQETCHKEGSSEEEGQRRVFYGQNQEGQDQCVLSQGMGKGRHPPAWGEKLTEFLSPAHDMGEGRDDCRQQCPTEDKVDGKAF